MSNAACPSAFLVRRTDYSKSRHPLNTVAVPRAGPWPSLRTVDQCVSVLWLRHHVEEQTRNQTASRVCHEVFRRGRIAAQRNAYHFKFLTGIVVPGPGPARLSQAHRAGGRRGAATVTPGLSVGDRDASLSEPVWARVGGRQRRRPDRVTVGRGPGRRRRPGGPSHCHEA